MKYRLMLAILIVFAAGCQGGNQASSNDTKERAKVQDSAIEHQQRQMSDQQRADYLATLAADIPEVKDASALVIGDFAVVGIQVDENLERADVGLIKYAVSEALKYDPLGANAVVVADPGLSARVRELGEDFRSGRPIAGILNELADITGRVIPQVPGDIIDDPHEKAKVKSGNRQDDGQNRSLEENQEKQSNYHLKQENTNRQGMNQP